MSYAVKLDSNGIISTPYSSNVDMPTVLKNINGLPSKQDGTVVFNPTALTNVYINKPVITTPTDGSTAEGSAVISSAYSTNDIYSGVHTGSVLEVATDAGFTNIVYTYTSDYPDSLPMYLGTTGTTYYIRVKYVSDKVESEWSDVVSYVQGISGLGQPVVTIDDTVTPNKIVGSAYSVINIAETHVSSDWEIATDRGFTNIVHSNLGDTVNLTSYDVPSGLDSNLSHYVRVKYNSANYSTIHGYTTLTVLTGLPNPVITMSASSLLENSSITGTIDNYSSTATYTITALNGTITYTGGSTFTYTSQDITSGVDEADTISVISSQAGLYDSNVTNVSLTILVIPYILDQTLTNADYGLNLDVTGNRSRLG